MLLLVSRVKSFLRSSVYADVFEESFWGNEDQILNGKSGQF